MRAGFSFFLVVAVFQAMGGVNCLANPLAMAASSVVTDSARLSGDNVRTRFVADLSEPVIIDAFTLANPYRVVIDMPNISFQLPEGAGKKGRGLIKSFRYGRFVKGRARIVVETNGPVTITRAAVVRSRGRTPAQLVVDLAASDLASFTKALKARKLRRTARRKSAPATPIIDAARDGRTVIVLDPGHGGIDSGAISRNGTEEKGIILAFGKLLRKKLMARRRYEVIMTRQTDVFVPLRKRVSFAQAKGADLFISLHADYVSRRWAKRARGATVYTLSKRASDRISRALAKHANSSDTIAGVEFPEEESPVRKILAGLLQLETNERTRAFSAALVDELRRGATKLKPEPSRSAAFRVLKAPDVASVLIELGYLSNSSDEKLLMSDDWRNKVAEQIAVAVDTYFAQRVAERPFPIEAHLAGQ